MTSLRCLTLSLGLLLTIAAPTAQAQAPRLTTLPPHWLTIAQRVPGFAGAYIDVKDRRPRLNLLVVGPLRTPIPLNLLSEEERTVARVGVVRVLPAQFTLNQVKAILGAPGHQGSYDPTLNRVIVPDGSGSTEPAGVVVREGQVRQGSRLGVFTRVKTPVGSQLALDVSVVNVGAWPVWVPVTCFTVTLHVRDTASGKDVTHIPDDVACTGETEVVLQPRETLRVEPLIPDLAPLPPGLYQLESQLKVDGFQDLWRSTFRKEF